METILRRERLILGGCLTAMAILAWLYLFHTKTAMPGMDMSGMDMPGMVMPGLQVWGPNTVLLLFVMWAVMMVAMMLPSATPMLLAFLAVNKQRQAAARARSRRPAGPQARAGLTGRPHA